MILEEIARRSGYVNFSTAFHLQTYSQSERAIQIVEDMLCCCVLEFKGNWEKYLSLVEFAYNNSFQLSIKMTPYEVLYGRQFELHYIGLSSVRTRFMELIW